MKLAQDVHSGHPERRVSRCSFVAGDETLPRRSLAVEPTTDPADVTFMPGWLLWVSSGTGYPIDVRTPE
jgi:hypothetical protein